MTGADNKEIEKLGHNIRRNLVFVFVLKIRFCLRAVAQWTVFAPCRHLGLQTWAIIVDDWWKCAGSTINGSSPTFAFGWLPSRMRFRAHNY